MKTLKAEIFCDINKKYPIHNGYSPGFDFGIYTLLSGEIHFDHIDKISPGENAIGNIKLFRPELLEDKFEYGTKYFFYEGPNTTPPVGYFVLIK